MNLPRAQGPQRVRPEGERESPRPTVESSALGITLNVAGPVATPVEDLPELGVWKPGQKTAMDLTRFSTRELCDMALGVFREVKTWGTGKVAFGDSSKTGSFYIHMTTPSRNTLTIRLSNHPPTEWRVAPSQLELALFDTIEDCLTEARRRFEILSQPGSALELDQRRRYPARRN